MPPPKSRKKLQSESFADASEPKDQPGEKAPGSDQSLDKALDLVDAMEESDSGIPVSNSSENTDDIREKSGDFSTSSGEPEFNQIKSIVSKIETTNTLIRLSYIKFVGNAVATLFPEQTNILRDIEFSNNAME